MYVRAIYMYVRASVCAHMVCVCVCVSILKYSYLCIHAIYVFVDYVNGFMPP